MNTDNNTMSDNQTPLAKRFVAALSWEKLVVWGLFLLSLWVLRNFLAVIFVTFILSYIAHHAIVRMLRLSPTALANNIWYRRSLVVALFAVFISALYTASLLVFPAVFRQGDELIATVQNVDPRERISEVAITYLGEKKLEKFQHDKNNYQTALKAYAFEQAGELAYTQFMSALHVEEAFRQAIFVQAANDADAQLENIEFAEDAFLDYLIDTHFIAQSDWRERFEHDMLNKLKPDELAQFRLHTEYTSELHDWLLAHLTPADLALYTEDPLELGKFEQAFKEKAGVDAYAAMRKSPNYEAQIKKYFQESTEPEDYPIYENIAANLAEFDRVMQQKFQYVDSEFYPYRDSVFYLDTWATWLGNTTEGNDIFIHNWFVHNNRPSLAITDVEFQRERQQYLRDTYLPQLLRENPAQYKKLRQQFEDAWLPTMSLYQYYFQALSEAYRIDFKNYYAEKNRSENANTGVSHEITNSFNHYLVQNFGETQWREITSSPQYRKIIENSQGFLSTHLGEITLIIAAAIKNTASFFVQFFVSVIFSFIIVLDIPHLHAQFQSLRKTRLRQFYDTITPGLQTFSDVMGKAFAAQAVIAVCNTIFTYVGMNLLHIPLAELMSVFVFFCSFIPVLGVFISSVPISLVALQTHGIILMLEAIALITFIHIFEAYLLNPKITGNFLKIHPLLVLMILFVGEHFFGIWGLLLGVPVCVYVFRYAILDMPFPRAAPFNAK